MVVGGKVDGQILFDAMGEKQKKKFGWCQMTVTKILFGS